MLHIWRGKAGLSMFLNIKCLFFSFITLLLIYSSQFSYGAQIDAQPQESLAIKLYPLETGKLISEGSQSGQPLIKKMVNSSANLSDYSAEYAMTVYKDRQILKESGVFYFRKPKLLRIQVKEGSRKGALAILASDGKIHGHLGGLMKYFSGAISSNSDLAKTINDFPMADSDFYSLAVYLNNMLKEGKLSLATREIVKTNEIRRAAFILDMYVSGTKPILLKRIWVDPQTYLPLFWQDYTKGKLWSESTWQNIRTDLGLPDKMFKP